MADNLGGVSKAAINVRKGDIDALFSPFHVDFFVSSSTDLTEKIIVDKVGAASGSKINVK